MSEQIYNQMKISQGLHCLLTPFILSWKLATYYYLGV